MSGLKVIVKCSEQLIPLVFIIVTYQAYLFEVYCEPSTVKRKKKKWILNFEIESLVAI